MISWFLWLDADPVRYWTLAWTVLGLTVLGALAAPGDAAARPRITGRLLFGAGLLLTLAAFRWPSWFVPTDLNPDEAQCVAGAITLQRFPVYWKFVDGTTRGPLCDLPLLAASVLGAPINYLTARIIAMLLQAVSLISVWGGVRRFASERVARLAVLPGLAFWALSWFDDYTHYSTELVGLCLLALAGWGLTRVFTSRTPSSLETWLIYLSGVALGAVPLAKLQSGPQAAGMALIALVLLWRWSKVDPQTRWRLAGRLIAGGTTIPLLTLVYLWIYGLEEQFWASYILSNLIYSQSGQAVGMMPSRFLVLSTVGYSFAWFLAGTLAFTLLYARKNPESSPMLQKAKTIGWIVLGIVYVSVILPGRESAHYLHLLVIPVTFLGGLSLASAMSEAGKITWRQYGSWVPLVGFVLLTLIPQIQHRAVDRQGFVGELSKNLRQCQSAAARFIVQRARPNDTLAMWGWEPNLFVQTGLAQGTRDGHSAFQLAPTGLRHFYVERYLADMNNRQPVWFVDAVGPGGFMYANRSTDGYEQTPALRALVADRYEFLTEIENKRIYRLKGPVPSQ